MTVTLKKPKQAVKTFAIIEVGKGSKDSFDAVRQLEESGFMVDHEAASIIRNHFAVSHERKRVSLSASTAEELGFKDGTVLQEICRSAKGSGKKFCSGEMGVELRKVLRQKEGECVLMIVNKSLEGDETCDAIDLLMIGTDKTGRYVRGSFGSSNRPCAGFAKFVFVEA